MRFDAVINKFVFEANFEKRITIHGNGEQARTFIHINQVARALGNVLHTSLPGGTYNLVSRNLKVMDVVDELKQLVPALEFIMINQHIRFSQLHIKENKTVNEALDIGSNTQLQDELREFLEKLSF
jgi:UDP-glucose 4-epimerase